MLNDVLNITRQRALAKDLIYRFEVAEDVPSVLYGDEIRIRQVMLNIINNAVKYTQQGTVSVEIRSEKLAASDMTALVICVSDTGIGIREEDKDKLFQSFQRLDERKNHKIEGTGLGLHITEKLVEMMGGRISVESEYGRGSVFTLYIPQKVMSEMNGEMTLRELTGRDLLHGTPVIALTADAIVGAKENYLSMGFTDYLSKPVKYENLEQMLKQYLPKEKQLEKTAAPEDLPVMLLWGTDADRLRDEKERLSGIYKCVCVVGSAAKEKYLSKHRPDGVMQVL